MLRRLLPGRMDLIDQHHAGASDTEAAALIFIALSERVARLSNWKTSAMAQRAQKGKLTQCFATEVIENPKQSHPKNVQRPWEMILSAVHQ